MLCGFLLASVASGFLEGGSKRPSVVLPLKPSGVGVDVPDYVPIDDSGSYQPVKVENQTESDGRKLVVMHDFNNKKACDTNMAVESTSCFQGDDGYYRYSCDSSDDENKIFTDVCTSATCDPDSCLNEWTWHEEYGNQCYSDGSVFYSYECTAQAVGEEYTTPEVAEGSSRLTCQQLGWEVTGKVPTVCARSKVEQCHEDVTFEEAKAVCEGVGARLCTVDELLKDAAKDSGCKGDCKTTWSNTECEGGQMVAAGATKCLSTLPETCIPLTGKASMRCCADMVNTASSSSGLPASFANAVATDFALEDGACGGQAAKQYSCWTNDATGQAQRFACNGDSNIWAQNCGTDTSCSPENCGGEWFTYGEQPDKCYKDAGSLYSYTCDKR